MSRSRRSVAVLAALLLFAPLAACGGDDDDDASASASAVEDDAGADDGGDEAEGEVEPEQAEVDDAVAAFCEDFNSSEGGDTPVEEVEASRDLALAAQTGAETQEGMDALQLLADFAQHVIDNDDGDGVITDAETSAAAAEFPTLEDAIAVVTEGCSTSRYNDGSAL